MPNHQPNATGTLPGRAAAPSQARADIASLPSPDTIVKGDIRWLYAGVLALLHALALLALVPWLFSWTGVIVGLVGIHVFGQAINLCYHRLLTHRSARVPKWLERAMVVMAICCLEDTPGKWVAIHRFHHNHSDEQDDPHSPLVAFLWAHVGWIVITNKRLDNIGFYARYAPDIYRDPFYMRLEKQPRWQLYIFLAHAAVFVAAGGAIGWITAGTAAEAVRMALSLLVWGVFVRVVAVWHITWSVNSLTHMFGYTNHETSDHSRNNWLVAMLTVGEGWHNNHHADAASASNQHRWWELDITYYQICLLEKLGLARDVIRPRHLRHAKRHEPA